MSGIREFGLDALGFFFSWLEPPGLLQKTCERQAQCEGLFILDVQDSPHHHCFCLLLHPVRRGPRGQSDNAAQSSSYHARVTRCHNRKGGHSIPKCRTYKKNVGHYKMKVTNIYIDVGVFNPE